jgi:hypothetical protein
MNTEQPQESFGSGASEAPAARSAELRSLDAGGIQAEPLDAESFVRMLLWDTFPECCGNPVVGAEYMGSQEMVCCGNPEPAELNDAQIVASLRQRFPEGGATPQVPDMRDALLEALEFIEDHADVSDGPDGSPRPNRAMQLCEPIRAALAKAGVKP